MKILAKAGREDIATVYIAETSSGNKIEFVESIQPPIPRSEKWVLIVSTLYGCPVNCSFCDAGGGYKGKVSKKDLLAQIDFLISRYFPDKKINVKKFKIQFARMGEPALNNNVIEALDLLPRIYDAPNLMPSISTVAPVLTDKFFNDLLMIKNKHYKNKFQLQFSIHTTDVQLRDKLIPVKKWDFSRIAKYGETFYQKGDRKITLNFALAQANPIDPSELLKYFDPSIFLIKITPINPTFKSAQNGLFSYIKPEIADYHIIDNLKRSGFEVILSIGELEENNIGSNCGQYLEAYENNQSELLDGYTYKLEKV